MSTLYKLEREAKRDRAASFGARRQILSNHRHG